MRAVRALETRWESFASGLGALAADQQTLGWPALSHWRAHFKGWPAICGRPESREKTWSRECTLNDSRPRWCGAIHTWQDNSFSCALRNRIFTHERQQPRHGASSASPVGGVKISILLWGYGRMAGKLVPARRDGLILARTNDDISRLGVMRTGLTHFCSVGRSAEGDQNA